MKRSICIPGIMMNEVKGIKTISLFILSFLLLASCGGNGGGGSSSSSPPPSTPPPTPPSVDLTAEWGGIYNPSGAVFYAPYANCPPRPVEYGMAIKLQQSSGTLSGTFATETAREGTISGSVSGNTISFTMTDNSSCHGSYVGHGTATNDSISFSYSGKDCLGDVGGNGVVSKLDSTSNIGWSGNWWTSHWDGGTVQTSFLTITTSDGIHYTGKLIFHSIDKGSCNSERQIVTTDLTGQYGWGAFNGHADPCAGTGDYNWMVLNLNNIQGQFYPNEVLISGQALFRDYYGSDQIQIPMWCFGVKDGGYGFGIGSGWLKRIK